MSPKMAVRGLATLLCLSCFACEINPNDRAPTQKKVLPPGFLLGTATAAYQVEGAWNVSGKSPSIWDKFTHTPGSVKDNSTGDEACQSYYKYQCDSAMLRYLGVKFYRFSISWPRILPNGVANYINQEGIDHYNDVIDDLLWNGIEPVVTIYHWDLPQCLQDRGGWANAEVTKWIEEYARILFENFGDRVKLWITLNEPNIVLLHTLSKIMAPGLEEGHGTLDYIVAKNEILAHARIWHLYDNEFRPKQKGSIGIAIATDYCEGFTNSPEDIQAAIDALDFTVGIFAHPIFTSKGGFPPRVVQLVAEKSKQQGYLRSRLPDFTPEEIEYCKGTSDFYGFNHYSTRYFTRRTYRPGKIIPSMEDDLGAKGTFKNYPRTTSDHIAVIPYGMRRTLKWVKDTYNNPSIRIMENGVATDEDLEDPKRIDYIKKYLSNVLDAVYLDGVNVTCYAAWSLMDNFEFGEGYGPKFGLFKVDHQAENKRRRARLSAIWYKHLISTGILDPDYTPAFEDVQFCGDQQSKVTSNNCSSCFSLWNFCGHLLLVFVVVFYLIRNMGEAFF